MSKDKPSPPLIDWNSHIQSTPSNEEENVYQSLLQTGMCSILSQDPYFIAKEKVAQAQADASKKDYGTSQQSEPILEPAMPINTLVDQANMSAKETTNLNNSIFGISEGNKQFDVPSQFSGLQGFFICATQRQYLDQCFKFDSTLDYIDKTWPISTPQHNSGYLILKNVTTLQELETITQSQHLDFLKEGDIDFVVEETAALALFTFINTFPTFDSFLQEQISKCCNALAEEKRRHFVQHQIKLQKLSGCCWSTITLFADSPQTQQKDLSSILIKEHIFHGTSNIQLCLLSWCEQIEDFICCRLALLYEQEQEEGPVQLLMFQLSPVALYHLAQDFAKQNTVMPQSTPRVKTPGAASKNINVMYDQYQQEQETRKMLGMQYSDVSDSSDTSEEEDEPGPLLVRIPISPRTKSPIASTSDPTAVSAFLSDSKKRQKQQNEHSYNKMRPSSVGKKPRQTKQNKLKELQQQQQQQKMYIGSLKSFM